MSHFHSMQRDIRSIQDPTFQRFAQIIADNLDTLEERITTLEGTETPDWRDFVMQNGWVSYATTDEKPHYWKDRSGWVHIKGVISTGTTTNGTVITTLPSGFRPMYIWPINLSNNGLSGALLEVNPNGDIVCQGLGGSTRLVINGNLYAQR